MKIAIIGAGGVGGYFGARLAAAGENVTFIARGAHLAAMREHGLRVESPLGNLHLSSPQATDDPASIGVADLAIIAVKLWSTDEAVQTAKRLLGPASAAVSFQNGVAAVDAMTRELGRERTLGGVAHIAAVIEAPGVIRHNGTMAKLTFGELDGAKSPRVQALHDACKKAGIEAYVSDDILRAVWEKFVFLVGLSGMTCLTRLPIGPVREDPVTREMLLGVFREVAALARARGVKLPEDAADKALAFADGLPKDMISSMLGDLKRGNRLELDWLSGGVARMAREMGVATPLNQAIYGALKLHAAGATEGSPRQRSVSAK